MGGSSGSFSYPRIDKVDILRKVKEAENETEKQQYEASVTQLLDELLGKINNRDTEAIQKHLDTIIQALNEEIEGTISTNLGGSISKFTHLKGISDVDALAILNNTELAKLSPSEVLTYFHEKLQARLPSTKMVKGDTAVTIQFTDGDIQIIPVIKYKAGIKLPSGNDWSAIVKPDSFAKRLTELNSKLNGRLVPAIKLVKGLIAGFSDANQLKGYHVESLAIQIFQDYNATNGLKLKNLVTTFFKDAPRLVGKPIKDITGQSSFVDEYLGKQGGIKRMMVAAALERTYRQIEMADTGNMKVIWDELFSNARIK